MTTTSLNPFPDYAVTRLAPAQATKANTVVTAAISRSRHLVETYIAGCGIAATDNRTNAALCAVRGDYGTGKTHLLNDAAAYLLVQCGTSIKPSILRATCVETNPLVWFRTKVGPQLDALPLYDVALQLYGRAGEVVAKATPLTESAAEVLVEDPARIRDLIRADRISIDEVNREFEKQLEAICADEPTVRRVLARLVSSETDAPARAWIRGATLSSRDAQLLRVPQSIESAEQASALVGAIAAMHKAVKRPFVVLVDELEHFVRYDLSQRSWSNVTWLKRLLEELGNSGALAFIAGHWSAWETTKDYLDRFPQHAPIDLVKLEAPDIRHLIQARLGRLPPGFDDAQAQAITAVTSGNMRRVITLCSVLFRQSDGFTTALTDKGIHEAWTAVAQRISQDQALEQIAALLVARGFEIKATDASFRSIPFDLVAQAGDGRAILVQAKHSVTQHDHYDAARQFIDKLTSAARQEPRVVGVFLANGSIDDELLRILRSSGMSNLRWFDLTDREVMNNIRAEIAAIDGQGVAAPAGDVLARAPLPGKGTPAGPSVPDSEALQLRAMNAMLEQKLRELDERRAQETEALKERLDKLAKEESSKRSDSVRGETEIAPERARESYEAMLEGPSLGRKIRYLGPGLWAGIGCIVGGIVVLTPGWSSVAMEFGVAGLQILGVLGVVLPVTGIVIVGLRYFRIEDYFEFSRQMIRDLYVRDVPVSILLRVDAVLRRTIDRPGSTLRNARERAIEELRLSKELPPAVRRYLSEIAH